jgi:glucosamine 6-phosphate synthetase-like amidotransferase/phosphosugar isomerase protein
MCGLAGLLLDDRERSRDDMEMLADTFGDLLTANEVRGKDATGVAWMTSTGHTRWVKAPAPATAFVRGADYRNWEAGITPHVRAIIGHTRMATRGTPMNRRNNHPIITGKLVGTHNGTIQNADELVERHGLLRKAEVDSEVLFRLINRHADQYGFDLDGVVTTLRRCRGFMTAIALNTQCPEEILLLRGNRPLCMRTHPGLGVWAYASLEYQLTASCPVAQGWVPFTLPEMVALVIRRHVGFTARVRPLRFIKGTPDASNTTNYPPAHHHTPAKV